MQELLDNPAVQAGLAPLLVALLVAALLSRTPAAWLAVVAGYATMLAMSTGLSFSPLTASRKVTLLVLLAPVLGLLADRLGARARSPALTVGACALAGLAAVWAMFSVLAQRESTEALVRGALLFAGTAGIVGLVLRLRTDGVASAAVGVGLGLATGLGALLSASIGYFMSGIALAAGSGAVLVLQMVTGRALAAGFTGAMTVGLAAALFAGASLMLAQLPWYAFLLMALVPISLSFRLSADAPVWRRAIVQGLLAAAGAGAPLLAAWLSSTQAG